MIGHAKNDGRLGRNHLLGHDGDKINALLVPSGHNMRLIPNTLALLFARILANLLRPMAKPDTWPPLPATQKSISSAFFWADYFGRVQGRVDGIDPS
jgi:IS5 family transposase